MWPSEGVVPYALDAHTGEVQWRNDTINALYLLYPHDGLSLGGPTSQGYLLSNGKSLAMPTGESSPAIFSAETGELVHWDARGAGSTWGTLIDGFVATPARAWQPDLPTRLGEMELIPPDGLAFYGLEGGGGHYGKWNSYDALPARPREGTRRQRGQIAPIGGRNRAVYTGDCFYASGMGELEAVDCSGDELKSLWKVEHERVYSLALADDVLIAGSDGFVSAVKTQNGEEIWRGSVDGQARGLAIAGDTLYVSTHRGSLYAFAPGHERAPAKRRAARKRQDPAGFALVVGDTDTTAAECLAAERNLHVLVLLPDDQSVQEARQRLLRDEEYDYGHDIVVHKAPEDGMLPHGDYFASEVLVVAGAENIRPSELYRVVRPITGRMRFADMSERQIDEFARRAGIPEEERRGHLVTRGRLAGAFDWDCETPVDERVSWPLKLHWFGGVGRQRILSRHRTHLPSPVPAAGRIFNLGDGYVIAVDAYTGKELWSYYAPGYRHVAADDNYAYISMGGHVMQVDAGTGKLDKIYGTPQPRVFSLDQIQRFESKSDDKQYGGTIAVAKTDVGVEVKLSSKTPARADRDGWVMWFDFRSPEKRLLPSGTGRFPLIVDLERGRLRRFDGFDGTSIPEVDLQRTAEGYVLGIAYAEIKKLTGRIPDTFDLSAEIELHEKDGYQHRQFHGAPLTQRRDPWRAGTATFVLRGEARSEAAPVARVDRSDRDDLPRHARQWGRVPQFKRHDGNIPRLPLIPEGREELATRTDPITGEEGDRFFLRGYGCGGTVASSTMNLMRSGTVGLYDLEDDSGMRNLPGSRPGCRITLSPSLGMLVSLQGTGDCFCPYNFPTSLAMAPARRRSNEDWAVFMDQERVDRTRQLGLNFGAPGDRRDEQGLLWLGYPKDRTMFATGAARGEFPQTIALPLDLALTPDGGPYRVNADRVVVENTKRPWIAASGIEGIRELALSLVHHNPITTTLAAPLTTPPRIDGRLDDDAWGGEPGIPVTADDPGGVTDNGRVQVRYDRENMYLSFSRQAKVAPGTAQGRRGVPQPWDRDTRFNVLLKDAERSAYAQFQVMLDGGMSSQALGHLLPLPLMANVAVDGTLADWRDRGAEIVLGEAHGAMRLGWTDKGLAVLMQVPLKRKQDFGHGLRAQFVNLEQERILELVIDREKGTAEVIRGTVRDVEPTVFDELGTAPRQRDLNHLREFEAIDAEVVVKKSEPHMLVEALIPLDTLALEDMDHPSVGFQLSAFDPRHRDHNITTGSGARRDLLAGGGLLTLVASTPDTPSREVGTASINNEWYGKLWRFKATRRDIATKQWKSAVHVGQSQFSVEMAVPLHLLAAVDLSMNRLFAHFDTHGKMSSSLDELHNRFRSRAVRIHSKTATVEPMPYTLRLHFAELHDVEPGERVFDIEIQGRKAVEKFDIAREAEGTRRAVFKEFRVAADQDLKIEFVPRVGEPWISGLELHGSPP
ncbi:MAG: PQQ-binding-like beta-propeller repeat protein [Planctomycetota bacterium]